MINRRNIVGLYAGTLASMVSTNSLNAAYEPPAVEEDKKIVFLDPGHGMSNRVKGVYDPGAVRGSFEEADITLMLAKEVGESLEKKGFEVVYSRQNSGDDSPLNSRAKLANQAGADIFVSIHVNSAENASATGPITFYFPESVEGEKLARSIQDSLVSELEEDVKDFEPNGNGLRPEKNFFVLRNTTMPAVLVETGFIDADLEYLTQNAASVAEGIVTGIENYLN